MYTILGASGFIGQNLCQKLLSLGHDVWAPKRNDKEIYNKKLGHVFYCIGATNDFLINPSNTLDAHVTTLEKILSSGNFESLVYLSSTRLYDSVKSEVVSEEDPLVFSPLDLRNFYDLSKGLGESLCRLNARKNVKVVRLSCVYKDLNEGGGFVQSLLTAVHQSKRETLSLETSPYYSRDYVFIDDVVEGLLKVLHEGKQFIYNIASGENVTNHQLFERIKKNCGVEILATKTDAGMLAPKININRMVSEFKWNPQSIISVINKQTVAYKNEFN